MIDISEEISYGTIYYSEIDKTMYLEMNQDPPKKTKYVTLKIQRV